MKKLTVLIILSFAMFACKSRKVTTSIVQTDNKIQTSDAKQQSEQSLDTSKSISQKHTLSDNNFDYEVDIVTDSGIISVNKGNFKGGAKLVTIKGNGDVKKVIDELSKQDNGLASSKISTDISSTQTDQSAKTKDKQSATTVSPYPWMAAVGAVLIVTGAVYLYFK